MCDETLWHYQGQAYWLSLHIETTVADLYWLVANACLWFDKTHTDVFKLLVRLDLQSTVVLWQKEETNVLPFENLESVSILLFLINNLSLSLTLWLSVYPLIKYPLIVNKHLDFLLVLLPVKKTYHLLHSENNQRPALHNNYILYWRLTGQFIVIVPHYIWMVSLFRVPCCPCR